MAEGTKAGIIFFMFGQGRNGKVDCFIAKKKKDEGNVKKYKITIIKRVIGINVRKIKTSSVMFRFMVG